MFWLILAAEYPPVVLFSVSVAIKLLDLTPCYHVIFFTSYFFLLLHYSKAPPPLSLSCRLSSFVSIFYKSRATTRFLDGPGRAQLVHSQA